MRGTDRYFAGIDLSTSSQARKGKTVAAILESSESKLTLRQLIPLPTDNKLTRLLRNPNIHVFGLDAPLRLPPMLVPSLRPFWSQLRHWAEQLGFQQEDVYHYRLGDLVYKRALSRLDPKPALSKGGPVDITPLTLRLLRILRALNSSSDRQEPRILEMYASATVQIIAECFSLVCNRRFAYRRKPHKRAHILSVLCNHCHLVVPDHFWQFLVESEDAFDAVVVGWNSWLASLGWTISAEKLLPSTELVFPFHTIQTICPDDRLSCMAYLRQHPVALLPDPQFFALGSAMCSNNSTSFAEPDSLPMNSVAT